MEVTVGDNAAEVDDSGARNKASRDGSRGLLLVKARQVEVDVDKCRLSLLAPEGRLIALFPIGITYGRSLAPLGFDSDRACS
jgi:hypothetical protein